MIGIIEIIAIAVIGFVIWILLAFNHIDYLTAEEKGKTQRGKKTLLDKLVTNPGYLFIFCSIIYSLGSLLYTPYLTVLDYSVIKNLADIIVETDGVIIGFSGIIVALVLKDVLEKSRKAGTKFSAAYKEKKRKIIVFIIYIVLILISSMFFGFLAIMGFLLLVLFSIALLFTSIIELLAMLAYSLVYDPEETA